MDSSPGCKQSPSKAAIITGEAIYLVFEYYVLCIARSTAVLFVCRAMYCALEGLYVPTISGRPSPLRQTVVFEKYAVMQRFPIHADLPPQANKQHPTYGYGAVSVALAVATAIAITTTRGVRWVWAWSSHHLAIVPQVH